MNIKTIKHLGLGLALAVGLTTSAKAGLAGTYTWVYGGETTYPLGTPPESTPASSGSLTVNSLGVVTAFTFTETPGGTLTLANVTPPVVTLLGDGNLVVTTSGFSTFGLFFFRSGIFPGPPGGQILPYNSANENAVFDNGQIGGDWVKSSPVPEPSTYIAGALMVLPFGASTMRIMRRKQSA
jgi:hypothetical protein